MIESLKIIRPVGNPILTKQLELSESLFSPFFTQFYHSGTASLSAAIIASHKRKSDIKYPEVIVPAYGCPDLISAIIHARAIPVLVDLEPDSSRLALDQIKNSINHNTIAIVAVRFFGIAEQNNALSAICRKNNLLLIEDSAQGFPVANMDNYWQGDYIILSFGRGKPVNTLGGGATLSRNSNLINELPEPRPVKYSVPDYLKQTLKFAVYNSSIHPLLYGLLSRLPILSIGQTVYKPLESIDPLPDIIKSLLNSNYEAYQRRPLVQKQYNNFMKTLSSELIIDLPGMLGHPMHEPLLRYPILIKDISARNKAHQKLKKFGASLMYQQPLYLIDKVEELIKGHDHVFPNAGNLADHLLTLPTHEGVTKNVVLEIKNYLQSI